MSAAEKIITADEVKAKPDVAAIDKASNSLVIDTRNFTITAPEGLEFAAGRLQKVKGYLKQLEELRTSMTKPLNESLRNINAFFKGPQERLEQAERNLKRSISDYNTEQERIRREQQARLEAEARREREALAAKQREEEARAREKEAALRRQADEAAAAGRVAEAAKLEAKAEAVVSKSEEKVEALAMREAAVVAPIAVSAAPKVAGIKYVERWHAEVVDPALVPREYLAVDEKKISAVVRSTKGTLQIAGVRIWSTKEVASGAA